MDLLNREHLRALAETQADPCASFYMPTFRFESEQEQNPIRLKNLLKEARQQLKASEHRQDEIDGLLQPVQDILDDAGFWRDLSDGLAIFVTPDAVEMYRLPLAFEELAFVGERFHLKPLFPLIAANNRYYVLALSQNEVKLYQGTHFALSEVEAKEIPKSITEVLAFDDPEQTLQEHTANRAGRRRDPAFHGQGGDEDDTSAEPHADLRRFFDQIDNGVREVLGEENAPLVLAGVAYYLPIYRGSNKYPHLVEDDIAAGNPEHLHSKELHEKTWAVVEPIFAEAQKNAVEQFHQQHGNGGGLASADLHEVIPASVFSRVDTLFVSIGRQLWGSYDPDANAVEMHEEQQVGDEDLLNFATVHTYLNGGTVHALRAENMPIENAVAATFRFPADVSAKES